MTKLNNYLTGQLGLDLIEEDLIPGQIGELPYYFREIYKIKTAILLNRKVLFLEQKSKANLTAEQYRKQTTQIENIFNLPVVLVLHELESYNRKRLIEKRIAFIIPGKQMFIPQFFIDLREFKNIRNNKSATIQPAAQCILLYHFLKGNISEMNLKEIAEKINYTQMTITRAAKDLEEKELCHIEGKNQRRIIFDRGNKLLWNKAEPHLLNPINRKIYIDEYIDESLIFKSGLSALSELTDIADNPKIHFAISKTDYMYLKKHNKIKITNMLEGRICLEIWKYAPSLFAVDGRVDPLSLSLTFKDSKDERIEMEIDKMINHLW